MNKKTKKSVMNCPNGVKIKGQFKKVRGGKCRGGCALNAGDCGYFRA